MKTKEELNALKNEVEALNAKLAELSEDELAEVSGGWGEEKTGPESWEDAEGTTSTIVPGALSSVGSLGIGSGGGGGGGGAGGGSGVVIAN